MRDAHRAKSESAERTKVCAAGQHLRELCKRLHESARTWMAGSLVDGAEVTCSCFSMARSSNCPSVRPVCSCSELMAPMVLLTLHCDEESEVAVVAEPLVTGMIEPGCKSQVTRSDRIGRIAAQHHQLEVLLQGSAKTSTAIRRRRC